MVDREGAVRLTYTEIFQFPGRYLNRARIRSACRRCVIERIEYLLPSPSTCNETPTLRSPRRSFPLFHARVAGSECTPQVASRSSTADYVYPYTSTKYNRHSSDVSRMIPNCWIMAVSTLAGTAELNFNDTNFLKYV